MGKDLLFEPLNQVLGNYQIKYIFALQFFDKTGFKDFMRHYEVSFIVDPVLSGDEIKSTAKTYQDMLVTEGCSITHVDELGLRQLAYSINKRSSGVYYTIEFALEKGEVIPKLELALRRDERIMRFLTVKLDKYGVKYNEDKRKGLIGKISRDKEDKKESKGKGSDRRGSRPAAKKPSTPPPPPPAPAETAKEEE